MPQHVLAMDDPPAFLAGLVDAVVQILPRQVVDSALTVSRQRSVGDRISGREGPITSIRLVAAGHVMELAFPPGSRYTAETRRIVGGIVIGRRKQDLGDWLGEFAGRIALLSGAAGGQPLTQAEALRTLGISVSGPDISVADESILADLRTLPFKLRGRLPAEATASIARLVDMLLETLPRLTPHTEADSVARRTATVYLPDTVNAYLTLPAGWIESHVYPDGSTPDGALVAQLVVLERAVSHIHGAAVRGGADGLRVNGQFLTERFGDTSTSL